MEKTIHTVYADDRAGCVPLRAHSDSVLRRRTLTDLPGPKGLPLVGNLFQLDLNRLHVILEQWADTYGPVYKFAIGRKPVVAVAEPDLINEVLRKRPEVYRRLGSIEPVLKEMGVNGVFSAEGKQWYRQRQVVNQALNTAHLRQFFTILTTVTERLKKRWERAAKTQQAVEAHKDFTRYTVDVTASLAFGYDVNTLEKEGDVIQQHLEKILPMMNRRINALFPYWHFFKLPADRALDKALVALRQAIVEFIAHTRARLAQNPDLATHPTNFLEAMLAVRDEGDAEFTDEEISGNILTMLVAGEDTTAYTLAWMVHFMAEYPDVQERMQREVDEVLGHASMLQSFQDQEQFPYIEAVAYETLRLKAVVPVVLLEANRDVDLDGIQLPAGTAIFLLTRHCGFQEKAFTEAGEFRPERWLAAPKVSQEGHNTKAFVPFGGGPRFCPGRNLALLEIKAVMAMLCRNFSVSKTAGAPRVGECFAVVMMPTNLSVNFKGRETFHRPDGDQRPQAVSKCPFAAAVS